MAARDRRTAVEIKISEIICTRGGFGYARGAKEVCQNCNERRGPDLYCRRDDVKEMKTLCSFPIYIVGLKIEKKTK